MARDMRVFGSAPEYTLEQYQERFKEHFMFKRENGIIEVKMHTEGDSPRWSPGQYMSVSQVLQVVGADPENECIIITAAGDRWLGGTDPRWGDYINEKFRTDRQEFSDVTYDFMYKYGIRILQNLVFDIDVPTIGAINGPSPGHLEFPLVCDITISADDVTFKDLHFDPVIAGMSPGDGLFLVYQKLFGLKKANYMVYTASAGTEVTAKEALDRDIINEVLPKEEILPRAWELARLIMKTPRVARRLTHESMVRPWRRILVNDANLQFSQECWAYTITGPVRDTTYDYDYAKGEYENQAKKQ